MTAAVSGPLVALWLLVVVAVIVAVLAVVERVERRRLECIDTGCDCWEGE